MIQGQVTKVTSKPWNDKTFYSVALNDGNWYGFGATKVSLKPGDQVEFEAYQNDKGYWQADYKSLQIIDRPTNSVDTAPSAAGFRKKFTRGSTDTASKDQYWQGKEARDVINDHRRNLGAARNSAMSWLALLVTNGAIPLGKESTREATLNELLDDYTARFMEDRPIAQDAEPAALANSGVKKKNKKEKAQVAEQEIKESVEAAHQEDSDEWEDD